MPEGFRPDIYYYHKGIMIIGEAKTSSDFDARHSQEQYLSYIPAFASSEQQSVSI